MQYDRIIKTTNAHSIFGPRILTPGKFNLESRRYDETNAHKICNRYIYIAKISPLGAYSLRLAKWTWPNKLQYTNTMES